MCRSKIIGQPPIICKRTRGDYEVKQTKPCKSTFLDWEGVYTGPRSSGKKVTFSTIPFKSRADRF